MQSRSETVENPAGRSDGRSRVEKVVETLAMLESQGETLTEVAHDTRNMVSTAAATKLITVGDVAFGSPAGRTLGAKGTN
jgi:hypothetical protein